MDPIEALREAFPEAARDTKLNLQAVLGPGAPGLAGTPGTGVLSPEARLGVALASAYAARDPRTTLAIRARVVAELGEGAAPVIEDAKAAATLMAMNNVFYRFRHIVGKKEYLEKPAKLRMNRLAAPGTSKAVFELLSLAVSAVNGCEACVRAHEEAVTKAGLTPDHVHEAVRIASVVQAAAIASEIAALDAP